MKSANEISEQRHGKGIPSVPVLVHQPVLRQFAENLVYMACAERLRQPLGLHDNLLHGELVVAAGFRTINVPGVAAGSVHCEAQLV